MAIHEMGSQIQKKKKKDVASEKSTEGPDEE